MTSISIVYSFFFPRCLSLLSAQCRYSDAEEPYEADEAIGVPVFLSATREDFLMELQVGG